MKAALNILVLSIAITFIITEKSLAQVKHNYLVGPQKTTCDSLDIENDDFANSLLKLQEATWRYSQTIHLNRPYGFRQADYYSCDGSMGYLVLLIDDQRFIYIQFPVNLWEEFTKTTDPDGFVIDKIKNSYNQIK